MQSTPEIIGYVPHTASITFYKCNGVVGISRKDTCKLFNIDDLSEFKWIDEVEKNPDFISRHSFHDIAGSLGYGGTDSVRKWMNEAVKEFLEK